MLRDDIEGDGGGGGAGDATPSPPPTRLPSRLSTPVARRGDSVASQFQREILGAASATTRASSSTALPTPLADDDIEISTPEHFATRGATIAFADADTEENDEGTDGRKRDSDGSERADAPITLFAATPLYATRRRTLSPSQAPQLLTETEADSAISRRDTVSPAALKSLLQSISLDDGSPPTATTTATATRSDTASSDSESAQEEATLNPFLETTMSLPTTPESTRKTRATKRKVRDERTLSPNEARLMTLDNDDNNDNDGTPSSRQRRSLSPAGGRRPDTTPQQTSSDSHDTNDSTKNDNDNSNGGGTAEVDERTLSPSEARLMTLDGDLASSSRQRRPLSPPDSSRPNTTPQQTINDSSKDDNNDSHDSTADDRRETPTRQLRSQQKSRRSTLEPSDAHDFLSSLRDELQTDSSRERTRASDAELSAQETRRFKRRKSVLAPLFEANVSPVTRAKARRTTADPFDIDAVAGNGGAADSDERLVQRRETLNVDDLREINSELRSASDSDEEQITQADERSEGNASSESVSRKRKQMQQQEQNPSESGDGSPSAATGGGAKKVRGSPIGSPPTQSVVSMASKQATGLARPQKTPTPRKPPAGGGGGDLDGSSRRGKGTAERQSLLAKFSSPPAQLSSAKTPLRGILSAKKTVVGPLTTPTKSVNFGPPQGAEFNLGSPSTSMTPMPAKEAKRMFPLDRAVTPPLIQEEEEDEETSLNTSLLDEADAIDSDDAEQKEEEKKNSDSDDNTMEMEVAGLSVSTTRSPDKSLRRFSLRGVSPLDNQANARRWRRSSMSAVVRSPVSARKLKGIGPGALSSIAAPSPAASRSVFLSDDAESLPHGRQAYADSSASSDAGEDMEITGDFSAFVQASGILSASAQKAAAAMPSFHFKGRKKDVVSTTAAEGDDNTVELGSLGDLVAESAVYDAVHERPTSSTHAGDEESEVPALGSLSDLAREGDEKSASLSSAVAHRFSSLHYSQLDEQDVTLDPIMEEEEDAANSSAPSRMSIATSEDESDAEYDERRKSLVVNLSSQFDRVGSGEHSPQRTSSVTAADLSARIRSPLRQSPHRNGSAGTALSVALISMEELLVSAKPHGDALALPDDHFRELYAENSASDTAVDRVKRAAISVACKEVVKWHSDEISAWSAGLSDVLGSLLSEKAPALFSPDVLDDAGVEAVKAVYDLETTRVQSGLCQWRTKMESELGAKLQASASELEKDVRALKQRVATDSATRASELSALRDLIAREQQMAELLDAIDEQQAVRNEYAATVESLETDCAALSLEASVLEDQLRVAENMASEGSLVSADAAAELERQVLRAEELSAIQSSLSLWRVSVATSSHLKLSAQFDDVVLRMGLCVDVVLSDMDQPQHQQATLSSGGFSSDVASTVTLKRRRRSTYLETERDIVRLAQQKLFDPVQLSRFVRTSNSAQHAQDKPVDRPRRICELLQELERYVALSYRFLRELRALSAQYAVEFIADESVLWVEFLNFAPTREAKFVVGFAILDEFPFANFETSVHVVHGPVSADAIRSEIDAEVAKQSDYEYISRICERLRNAFVLR